MIFYWNCFCLGNSMRGPVDMSTLMLPSAPTMTTMTNTAPIPVSQQKTETVVKSSLLANNNNCSNKQGRDFVFFIACIFCVFKNESVQKSGIKSVMKFRFH